MKSILAIFIFISCISPAWAIDRAPAPQSINKAVTNQTTKASPPATLVISASADNLQHQVAESENASNKEAEKPFWKKAENDPTAAATIAMAFFTLVLIFVGACQARQIRRSVDAMRAEFIATHRPRILVHRFVYDTDANKNAMVEFTIVNSGETKATQISAETCSALTTNIYLIDELVKMNLPLEKNEMQPGERLTIRTTLNVGDDSVAILADYMRRHGEGGTRLIFTGSISYANEDGSCFRETGFHRIHDPLTDSWQRIPESEYEYSY